MSAGIRRTFRLTRRLPRLLAGLGVLVLPLLAVAAFLVWHTLPAASLTTIIPGLSDRVEIGIDADGIPHIRAATETDAAAALGFLHARDRLLQMELMRSTAAGTLAEIAGPAALPSDRLMRTLGLKRAAEADLAGLPPETLAMLAAYANGVNAYIALRGRFAGLAFLALGRPARWAPVDSLLWAKTMGLYLSGNWRTELARAGLLSRLSAETILSYWPDSGAAGHPEASLLRLPPPGLAATATRLAAVLPSFPDRFTLPATASNAWAVDGAHSTTGAPLLAGDPHLGFSMPGPWYLARIDTPAATLAPATTLAGATAPGVPFMVLGHNRSIAWSFTTTGADVQDLFVETPVGADQYQTPDGPRPFETRSETIHVRGQPDEILHIRSTRHGPVISDLIAGRGPILALQMANLAPGDTASAGLLALNQAKTVAEALAAAPRITSPVQNLLVADRSTIALAVTGRVPLRKSGDGALPAPGADGSHDWTGWASGAELPRIVAPASGRLVNANERVAPPDFPVFLGRDWYDDLRARRIRQMLDARPKHDVADFTAMQMDTLDLAATDLLPRLTALPAAGVLSERALTLLRIWNGRADTSLPQPLIFTAWMQQALRAVLARRDIPPLAAAPWPVLLPALLTPAGARLCGGECGPLFAQALAEALTPLAARYGADPFDWRWGEAHPAVFAHPLLSRLPGLHALATAEIAAPGDVNTVNQGGSWLGHFRSVHGASFRAVYDLADLDRSRFMLAPGQSGHILSPVARNFLSRWRNGATISLGPDMPAAGHLRLLPPFEVKPPK
jgi:penicillin amidase